MPLLETEKQLQDLKAEQRKAQKRYCLDEVISKRAYHEAGEEVRRKLELDPESIEAEALELWQQAEQQIAGMIQAGASEWLDIRASDDTILQREGLIYPSGKILGPGQKSRHRRPQDLSLAKYQTSDRRADSTLPTVLLLRKRLYQAGLPEWVRH